MTSLMAWEREEREESALPMAVCVHACEIECWMLRDNYALRGEGGEGGEKEEWERRRKEGRKEEEGVIYQRNHYCSERSLQWQHQ